MSDTRARLNFVKNRCPRTFSNTTYLARQGFTSTFIEYVSFFIYLKMIHLDSKENTNSLSTKFSYFFSEVTLYMSRNLPKLAPQVTEHDMPI